MFRKSQSRKYGNGKEMKNSDNSKSVGSEAVTRDMLHCGLHKRQGSAFLNNVFIGSQMKKDKKKLFGLVYS